MSNLSQFAGGTPVGTQALMVDVGPTVTLADNSTWLRSGVLTTTASAPQLAAIKNYQVVGTVATTSIPSGVTVIQLASNGSGTLVATTTTGNQTIYRSTDSGATWAAVVVTPSNFGGVAYVTGVAYGGGRFVASAWTTTGSLIYSTDGLTWTLGATIPLLDGLNNHIRLVYASGQFVGACQGHTSSTTMSCFTFYSTNGSVCATYNSGASLNSVMNTKATDQQGFGIISSGATVIVYPLYISSGGFAPWVFSLDSGVTWSSITPTGSVANTGYYLSIAINGTAVSVVINSSIYNFANLTSPTVYTKISTDTLLGYSVNYLSIPLTLFSVGTKTFASPGLNYIFQMSNDLKSIAANSYTQLLNISGIPISSTDLSITHNSGVTTVYDVNLSTYSYCGIKTVQFPPNNSNYNGEVWYVRAS